MKDKNRDSFFQNWIKFFLKIFYEFNALIYSVICAYLCNLLKCGVKIFVEIICRYKNNAYLCNRKRNRGMEQR